MPPICIWRKPRDLTIKRHTTMMRRGTRRTLLLDPDSLPKQDAKRKTATTESSSEQSDSQMILPQTVSAHELRSERLPPRQRRRRKVQRNETCPCCSFLLPLRQRPCTTKRSRSIYVTWAVTMLAAGVLLTSFASLFMALMFVGNFPTSSSQSPFFYLSFFGLQSLPFPIYGLRNDDVYGGRRRNLESLLAKQEFTVLFCVNRLGNRTSSVALPGKLDEESRLEAIKRDDGDLNVKIIEDEGFRLERRIIYHDFDQDMRYEDMINGPNDDDYIDNYYAFDDDERRNTIRAYADKTLYKSKKCRRTSWHRDLPINCNNVHEFDVEQRFRSGDTTFLGAGAYRQAYISKLQPDETVVFKEYYWGAEYSYDDFEYMRMDAIVAEKLTAFPNIVDIYGFCATGMINQAMNQGVLQKLAIPNGNGRLGMPLDPKKELVSRNELTVAQKIRYSLEMAEGVRVLHSFHGGVIVHDDIQLSQFLLDSDGTLKLNDFNRAEIMLWDDKGKGYCRYRNNPGHGDWRAPEEYFDEPLNEKIDIWSLGNNIFSLLTGLFPFYEEKDTESVQSRIMANQTAFIDPRFISRNYFEKNLFDIVQLCWVHNPDDRIDIFSLVYRLRALTKEFNNWEGRTLQMQQAVIHKIKEKSPVSVTG